MRDSRHADHLGGVIDDVHHSPVSDANAPLIFVAFEFFATRRPRSVTQRFKFADNTASTLSGKDSSSFRAAGFTSTA